MAFPVEIAVVEAKPVEFAVNAVGSVEAFETVQVTARVAGAVEKVRFTEGQEVKKGEVLAEIEPQRYQLAVRAAQSTLAKAKAGQAEARASLQRREQVNAANPGLIRGEELESFRTRAETAGAEAAQAQVAVEQAELNLRDAYVRAPVSGVLQTRSVQTGQYVQPGFVLATMVQREPLLLRFQVSETDAARLANGAIARFKVKGEAKDYEAKIVHIGASASQGSRQVPVTAEVADPKEQALRPGVFAEVTVPIARIDAPVIPQTSVRPSERGFLAFVIDDQNKAHERVLTLGMRTEDGRVEVRSGLQPGDKLVVRGAEALKEGAAVTIPGAGPAGGKGGAPAGQREPQDGGKGGRGG